MFKKAENVSRFHMVLLRKRKMEEEIFRRDKIIKNSEGCYLHIIIISFTFRSRDQAKRKTTRSEDNKQSLLKSDEEEYKID